MSNKSINDIIRSCGTGLRQLSANPGHYAGRGNSSHDLDSARLEALYQGVLNEFGPEKAKCLVHLIYALAKSGDVSASRVIGAIATESDVNGWTFRLTPDQAIVKVPYKGEEPKAVVGKFLNAHAAELPKGIPAFDAGTRHHG